MKPFKVYAFQRSKNVFVTGNESVDKWIGSVLKNGAALHVSRLMPGPRVALHKRDGRDFLFHHDGLDKNLIESYPDLIDDFTFHGGCYDFVIEGSMTENDVFCMDDILYLDGMDLSHESIAKRRSILENKFGHSRGLNSFVSNFHLIHDENQFKRLTIDWDGFHAIVDSSLYTEGCPSGQSCSVGKDLDVKTEKSLDFSADNLKVWSDKIQKGVSGDFHVLKTRYHHLYSDVYELVLAPVRPVKSELSPSISFRTLDKDSSLKRQFKKGNQFVVGFNKYRSPNPREVIASGTFTVLKSSDQSSVIDLDGPDSVFKGIFHVGGVSKHNIKDPSDVPNDIIYQLSFSDANIPVDKRFGQLTWTTSGGKNIEKSMEPIVKQEGEEERFVFGEVLVPNEIDAHGDIYSAEEVRFAAHFFMEKFGNTGLMHEQFINDDAAIIETFVAPVSMTIENRKIKKGTWLIGMRIMSERLFEDVKAGRLTGFSIGGIATVQELRKLMREYA